MLPIASDRRTALKLRHRAAILAAAAELVAERGGPSFSVDELAERADVARRTVFNHFAGLDDVLLTVCEETLAVLVEDFLATVAGVPVGDGSPAAMFDELAAAMRASDLPAAIIVVLSVLETTGTSRLPAVDLTEAAFARVVDRLVIEVGRRNPGVDPLDAELLVNSLMHGIAVIAKRWAVARVGRSDQEAAAEWALLLEHVLDRTRSGYMPT
ncbi:TetR/AcrR family transcriptional regulator [Amnibacterium endophyticum]|uniref:TetR/AcrR family transcriptional regulator n=1 Tax=Amnibacterium endophyticum TaxID=2109337 RepID=UPI00366CE30A